MIRHIKISNFAIIENSEVDFEDGLNIITGETGSGKSIVIEAISLALGSRADSSFVRHGCKKAVIQLICDFDDEEYIITREISAAGKNICKINGEIVTLGELSSLCRKLADIHGQYDNQSLLNPDNHIKLVDQYHHSSIGPAKEKYAGIYKLYTEKKSELKKLLALESSNAKQLDFYRYEKSEIESADLKPGEDEALAESITLLQNSEKIFSSAENAYEALSGEGGAVTSIGNAMNAIKNISEYSKVFSDISEDITDIYYKLEDISDSLRTTCSDMTFSPEELDAAIFRLDHIDNLKKKYGSTIEDILAYYDKISEELLKIENFDDEKEKLEKEVKEASIALSEVASELTQLRKAAAIELSEAIEKELHDLNFSNAKLEIDFKEKEPEENGIDIIEIMMSGNIGEPLKPLAKTASGGEISRIMLAIKKVTCVYDSIPTMIFDEIDTGISGYTASVVARKLHSISENHQIICITHLPQIAAAGDYCYKIFKDSDGQSTFTHIEPLDESERVDELARLLGGETITETTRQNARELIEASRQS